MITLTVTSFNNTPSDGTLSASFDELGGSIGRADSNQLVLPDPERSISRVAAQLVYRNGSYAIVDRGSNPIVVNGQALGSGREAPLKAGDRVRIGGYELMVKVGAPAAATASSNDPFADLLGPASAAQSHGAQHHAPHSAPLIDPLAGLARGAAATPGRASAAPPAPPSLPTPARAGAASGAASSSAAGIPTDWDPFAPDSMVIPGGAAPRDSTKRDALGLDMGAAAPAALIPELSVRAAEPSSLDQLFGLGPAKGGDPLANSVLDAPMAKPNMAANADPLRSLNSAPQASAQSAPDHLSDLNRPFIPPKAIRPAPPAMPAAAPATPRPLPPAPAPAPTLYAQIPKTTSAVMSWDSEGNTSHMVIRSPVRPAEAGSVPVTSPAVRMAPPAMTPSPAPAPAAAAPSTAAAISAAAPSAHTDALLAGLRRGLGAPELNVQSLTPELMELLGSLLHEAASGTVDLLTARATFKRELRAKGTTIVARNNNPLKFSPSAEVALQHMLSPPTRGFMAAAPAMRDAYNDLRAHQVGFVAGLQAALDGVLQRFDPGALEGHLGEKSMLHALLPSSRKARLWELFVEHTKRIRAEASDDFHVLFGTAFLKAYEEQIDRLHEEQKK